MDYEETQLLNPLINGFIRCGFRVADASDGCYHIFNLSEIPYIELELPMNRKIISIIVQYFYNVCDICIKPDTNKVSWGKNTSMYEQIMLSDNRCIIRLSFPLYIFEKLHKKKDFENCRTEFIDLFKHRMILFEQKMLTIKL